MGRFDDVLAQYGRDVEWLKRSGDGSFTSQGVIKAMIQPMRAEALLIEPGYGEVDYLRAFTASDLSFRDRLVFDGQTWEVQVPQKFECKAVGERYFDVVLRRIQL